MADGCLSSVGDPDHGPIMAHPSEASVSHMYPNQIRFNSITDSALSSPFSQQHRPARSLYERAVSASSQDPLMQWWRNDDGPWVPPNFAQGCDGRSASRMRGLDQTYLLYPGQYRETCAPSECDTTATGIEPSDSGYGSNVAKHSIANISVFGEPPDRCPEAQSLAGQLSDFNFQVPDSGQWPTQPPPVDYRNNQLDAKGIIVCETCNKQLKTNSELKKHKQRHTKPYHCQVPGCIRIEGFSTPNDLDRHKRSVHPDETVAGNRYQCSLDSCKTKQKMWPRADNFRAHLKRVHGLNDVTDEALEPFIYRPPHSAQDRSMNDTTSHQLPLQYNSGALLLSPDLETSFAPNLHSLNADQAASSSAHHESYNVMALPAVPVCSTHMDLGHMTGGTGPVDPVVASPSEDGRLSMTEHLEVMSSTVVQTSQPAPDCPLTSMDSGGRQFVAPGDFGQRACTPRFSVSSEIETAPSMVELPEKPSPVLATASPALLADDGLDGSETSVSVLDAASHRRVQDDASQETRRTGPAVQTSDLVQLILSSDEKTRKVVEALERSGKLLELGFKKDLSTYADKTEDSAAHLRQEHQHPCTVEKCDKTFARLCELKKHAKRHSKPYGCTYQGCNKRFGSKNDWKRHENGQHFLLEVWKCEEPRSKKSPEICGRVSHRRETFKDHLIKSHGLHDRDLDAKMDKCRAGRNCESRFWCGFCEQIVETQGKRLEAWKERFDHIDNHIHGKKGYPQKDIEEWKDVDPDAPLPVFSGSDTDDDDGLGLAPPDSQRLTREPRQSYSRNTGAPKRKTTDMEPDERQTKRMRRDQPLRSGVMSCCNCGDGNSSNTGPQCVSSGCQHILCPDCPREYFEIPIGDDEGARL